MILIAESGSTKTDWVLVNDENQVTMYKTMGFNPFFHSSEFIANKNTIEEIAENMGADKLFYQDLEDLVESVKFEATGPQEFDTSCFNGFYVTDNVSSQYLEKIERIRSDSSKQQSSTNEEPIGIHNQG